MSNEIINVEQDNAIQPLQTVDVGAAEEFMVNYQELVEALLDDGDYQDIPTPNGVKKSKKKSAWRKLATAFNISDDIVEKEIIRDECQRIISARYEVIATLPNGRHGVGTGSASIFDKINKKDTNEPTPFQLRRRYTNAEHDIISTAHTRAKSRAISDLIGAGEVSAEELSGAGSRVKTPRPMKPKSPVKPTTIEVKAEVEDLTGDKPSMSFKEMCDNNKTLSMAVKELQANEETVNRARLQDKLLDLMDNGKISSDEYREAKELLV